MTGGGKLRPLYVDGGTVTVNNLNISGGNANGGFGGGILVNNGTLTMTGGSVTGSTSANGRDGVLVRRR